MIWYGQELLEAVRLSVRLPRQFAEILAEELEFWRARAPSSKVGWWNGAGLKWADITMLRNRYSKARRVLHGLGQMRYRGSRKSVRAFRDYWRSLPQLEGRSESGDMNRVCDAVLTVLAEEREASKRPDSGDGP